VLRALIPRSTGEELRFALVGGEAGSGKSRLIREFAHEAASAGALVLYGACDSAVRRPYRPFGEALDQLIRSADGRTVRSALGPEGRELARLLPDLSPSVDDLTPAAAADPDTERHRLHSAVADLLAALGREVPLVLVIEDGHWADTPTLLLLRHLARGTSGARALIVTTFRDTEAEVPQALSAALVELRRSEGVVRLRLGGLSAAEINQFVAGAVGGDPGFNLPEVADVLFELTRGNAFLITELWRMLLETDSLPVEGGSPGRLTQAVTGLGSPDGVREVLNQRLARLSDSTTGLLELAAVAGAEFGLPVITGSGLTDSELSDALEQATAHGIIEELPSGQLAYRFTHELVRHALYERLPALRRAALHLQVAEALEGADRTDARRGLAELAHHFGAAAALDGPERAIEYSVLAGRAALSALDFDEAAVLFSSALEHGIKDPRWRAETQLELGAARFRAGRSDGAMEAFQSAAQIGRDLDDAELLATAAVGFEDACWRPGITDQGAVGLLEEASRALGTADSTLRVMLLAGLLRAYAFVGDYRASEAAQVQAIDMTRRLGDGTALATVLIRSFWTRAEGESMEETLEMLLEARNLAQDAGDTDLQSEAMEWRVAGLISIGALAEAQRELVDVHALAARVRQPFALHIAEHFASTLALCAGNLAEAESAAQRSHEWSRLLTGRPASGTYGIQMFGVRREQGRLAELAAATRILAASDHSSAGWRPGFAALLAELGMEDEASRQLTRIRREGLEQLRSTLWLASLTYLADACAVVGDTELAELVYHELAPLAGGNVAIGQGVACYGAADRFLGLLATTLHEHECAIDHFERALELNREMGATTWVAHTLYAYGRMLLMRGTADDAERAPALVSSAATLAERIGMPTLLARATALGARSELARMPPDELSWREVDILRLVATGLSNREIGERLSISGHTVANHVRSILRKTGAANRTEAAGYAHRHALVDRPPER
jgi:DNA-binding CsgD family transcriptional regulator/tetratricopeptide (TPR) repeat protein/KaiC/GvpD/RAD55 family RecA-like ATPase